MSTTTVNFGWPKPVDREQFLEILLQQILDQIDADVAAAAGMANPMTTAGDLIRGGSAGAAQRLAAGSNGQVLKMAAGVPTWAAESGGTPGVTVVNATGNAATDTANLQASINAGGVNGGRLQWIGDFQVNAEFTFPALVKALVIELYGSIWLTSGSISFQHPGMVDLIGLGGYNPNSFQYRRTAAIIGVNNATAPVYRVHGNGPHYTANMFVGGYPANEVIKVDAASTVEFENVSSLSGEDGEPSLLINETFWFKSKGGSYLSLPAGGPAIKVDNTTLPFSGLVYFEDTTIAGRGVHIKSSIPASSGMGNVFFYGFITYESGVEEMFTIDTTNAFGNTFYGILAQNAVIADQVAVPAVLKIIGEHAANISFEGSTAASVGIPLVAAGSPIPKGVHMGNFAARGSWDVGPTRLFSKIGDGEFNGSWSGRGHNLGPNGAPHSTLPVNTDVTTWGSLSGTATVTTGIIAPDGTATAARLTSAAGLLDRQPYRVTITDSAAGDWYICGVWAKPATAGESVPAPAISLTAGNIEGSGAFDFRLDSAYQIDAGWLVVIGGGKVTSVSSATTEIVFSLRADATACASCDYWQPFLIRIKASEGYSDADVVRMLRYMAPVAPGLSAGDVALYAHQKLKAPGGINFGSTGPTLRNSGGTLEIRNSGDTGYADLTVRNQSFDTGGAINLSAGGELRWAGRARFLSPGAGLIKAVDAAGTGGSGLQFIEMSDPSAPAANNAIVYTRDDGSGKTQLCVRFPTGAVQVIATEP